MSINFSTLQGLTIPEGVVTQITDASGRVLWTGRELIDGFIMCLRPSGDISVGHNLYPASSTAAHLLISEEKSDGNSTYIHSDAGEGAVATSKFALSITGGLTGEVLDKILEVTSVQVTFDPYASSTNSSTAYNACNLEIDGVLLEAQTSTELSKNSSFDFPDAILLINEALASNGVLPIINLIVTSYGGKQTGTSKTSDVSVGITTAWVTITCKGYK